MKNITIIYPDGSVHRVSALAVQRYRLDGNSFNLLVYAEGDETYITPLAEIGGTLCKIPYHNIDLESAELLGEVLPDRLPNVILSAVLLEPGQDMTDAYTQIQEIANQAETVGEWFTKPQDIQLQPENPSYNEAGHPQVTFDHNLYATYLYGEHGYFVGPEQITYEHLFNVYRQSGRTEFEFKKPLLFQEVKDEITRIIREEKRDSLLEEIPEHIIEMPVAPGTTVADYIVQPDGRVQVALALAIPGIHRYNVTFGKCPDATVYEEASLQENQHLTVFEREYNGAGNQYAFQGGLIGLLPIIIGGTEYDSVYKLTESTIKKPSQR